MLQRAKYNRFRNESVTSVDELLLHGLPMNGKVPAGAPVPAPDPPYAPAAEAPPPEAAEDSGTALCTLINKVSSLKFTNSSGLLGIKGLPSAVKDLAVSKLQGGSGGGGGGGAGGGSSGSPASSSSLLAATGGILCASATSGHHELGSMSTGKKGRMEEAQSDTEDWHAGGVGGTGGECTGLMNKPSRGWLHSSDKIVGPGVTYVVKVWPPSSLSSFLSITCVTLLCVFFWSFFIFLVSLLISSELKKREQTATAVLVCVQSQKEKQWRGMKTGIK